MHGSYSYDTQLFKLKIPQQHYLIIYLEDSSTSHIISQKGLKTRISTTPHFALSGKIGAIIAKRTSVTWVKWERYVGSINTPHEHIWNWITISSTGSISIMKLLTGLSLSWLRIQKKKKPPKPKQQITEKSQPDSGFRMERLNLIPIPVLQRAAFRTKGSKYTHVVC